MLVLWTTGTLSAGLSGVTGQCYPGPYCSYHLTAAVGKRQLAGLAGQRPAGEICNAPSKVYQTGLSLGLSAFGSIAGIECTFTIDTGSDITIVRPDILQASGTRMVTFTGQIRTVTGAHSSQRAN